MTIEAIKSVIEQFGEGPDQNNTEASEQLKMSLDLQDDAKYTEDVNEVFTDASSKARLGLEAINFPPGRLHSQAGWTSDEQKILTICQKQIGRADMDFKHVNALVRAQVYGMFPGIKLDENVVNPKVMRERCSCKENELHVVQRAVDVSWKARTTRDICRWCPAGWFLKNHTLTHVLEPMQLPHFKVKGTLVSFHDGILFAGIEERKTVFRECQRRLDELEGHNQLACCEQAASRRSPEERSHRCSWEIPQSRKNQGV